jgi:hypothetical protein
MAFREGFSGRKLTFQFQRHAERVGGARSRDAPRGLFETGLGLFSFSRELAFTLLERLAGFLGALKSVTETASLLSLDRACPGEGASMMLLRKRRPLPREVTRAADGLMAFRRRRQPVITSRHM